MLPFTFTVLLTVGGWIFKIGQSSSRFDADELRITTLESIIVDKTIMAEKEKAQAMHNADVERRLERIEIKVDDLLTKEGRGHPR